jgi:hypothetical protein
VPFDFLPENKMSPSYGHIFELDIKRKSMLFYGLDIRDNDTTSSHLQHQMPRKSNPLKA